MKRIIGAASIALLALTGCSGEAEKSELPAQPTTTVEATTTPEYDALAACDIMIGGTNGDNGVILVAPELILSIGSEMPVEQTNQMLELDGQIKDATTLAPPELASYLTEFGIPFAQLADAKYGGGGEISLDTGHVKEAAPKIIDACSAAGYEVGEFAELSDTPSADEATDEYNHALFRADVVAAGIYLDDDDLVDSVGDNACAAFDSVGVEAAMEYIAEDDPSAVELNATVAPMAVERLCPQHSQDMNSYLANH